MRCAHSEELARHEREVDKAEKAYEAKCEAMFSVLDDLIEQIYSIGQEYELITEATEYVEDKM